jgi:ATP-binding cassette, subfamily G (WHITE), member 2, SNQ2
VHFPTLKVSETVDFATSTKLPKTRPDDLADPEDWRAHTRDSILSSLGISHTADTIVGDEFVRGVSGGERKRVSLAEVMAAQAPLQCWDNSTRGLDASNALDFAKVLRRTANEQLRTIIATLYQAGNGIYSQFDKVLILVEGREIYYGPRAEARQYFEDMGFVCARGANVADFLTSVAVPTERMVKPGFEGSVPNTAEEFEQAYKQSKMFARMQKEMAEKTNEELAREIEDLKAARHLEKNRTFGWLSRDDSPYQVSFGRQVLACTKRLATTIRNLLSVKIFLTTLQAIPDSLGRPLVQRAEDRLLDSHGPCHRQSRIPHLTRQRRRLHALQCAVLPHPTLLFERLV